MALFGFGKDKREADGASEPVLAYLEEAQRTRASFILLGPRKVEIPATLQAVDEAEGLLAFHAPSAPALEKGFRMEFLFFQEGLRLGGRVSVEETRSGLLLVALPETLELEERRGQPRAKLNPKEGCSLTALTGLFEGVGITGIVENLSEGGARVRVEKALNLKGEKRLPLGTALIPPGQAFMLIKLNKAPKCPAVMEFEGRAAYLDASAGGLTVGIAFDPPKPDLATALRNLVASRTSPIPAALPPKARRRPEAAPRPADPVQSAVEPPAAGPPRQPLPAPAEPAAGAQPPAVRAAVPSPPPASSPPPAPAAPIPASVPGPGVPARNEAILRLKKRSRAVVALAPTPAAEDLLREHLHKDGFGRALVTASRMELLEFLQQPNLGVLFLDGNLSILEALELIGELRQSHPALPPIVLAVEEVSAGVALAARRRGVAQILVKPYALDASFSDLLNQQL